MIAEDISQATDPATRAWKARLIEESRKKLVRQSALERQQNYESMKLPEDFEFDALDFSAVVKNSKESDDDA